MAIKKGLGRGLDTLIPMDDTHIPMDDVPATGTSAINEIPLEQISPNPEQPRTDFDDTALEELALSIRQLGIIQPLSLRKNGPSNYLIIAGERRYRAAIMAGLTSVPAYIRNANEEELTEMALIENIQREDLNPIEIALAYKKLIDTHNLTQEKLSERIGKKRATIANFLRLVHLPAEVQMGLRNKEVDMGHARALLSIPSPAIQIKLYQEIVKKGLSVRRVEELAKKYIEEAKNKTETSKRGKSDFDVLQRHLSSVFRSPVSFAYNKNGRGSITFKFKDEAELERLITIFDSLTRKDEA